MSYDLAGEAWGQIRGAGKNHGLVFNDFPNVRFATRARQYPRAVAPTQYRPSINKETEERKRKASKVAYAKLIVARAHQ